MPLIRLKVSAKARHNRIIGWHDGRLKLSVTTAPEQGKANQAVIDLLAASLDIPVSEICITAGLHNSLKTVQVNNLDDAECRQRLAKLLE